MKKIFKRCRLSPTSLSGQLPKSWLPFRTTEELDSYKGIIGQQRALRAVEMGLKIPTRGFNIFAVGEPGSGKTSTLERILKDRSLGEPVGDDICYVYNFEAPDCPLHLVLPPGVGRKLAKHMEQIVKEIKRIVPRVLSDGEFGQVRSSVVGETQRKAEKFTQAMVNAAKALDLLVEEDADQMRVVPLLKGQPILEEDMDTISAKARKKIENNLMAFQKHADEFTRAKRKLEKEHDEKISELEINAVSPLVKDYFKEAAKAYSDSESVIKYLQQVENHVLENLRLFKPEEEEGDTEKAQIDFDLPTGANDPRILYHVNVVVDRSSAKGAAVVLERVPSLANLCGFFEYRETAGGLVTDHTMIRAGALHNANGGYLLLQAQDVLNSESAWPSLKRALRHKEIRIEEGLGSGEGRPRLAGLMKPEAIALNVKVILVGNHELYYTFKIEDENFQRLFKILADFEHSMDRNKENVGKLAEFAGQVCKEEGYLPVHRSGMARIVEFATRRTDKKQRLTTKRAEILDLLAEADMFAKEDNAKAIRKEDVEKALSEINYRHGAVPDAVQRELENGSIMIRTDGHAQGQINGIAVYDLAGIMFGIPVRITARTYAGRRGVVNIDREVNLSGAVHDKGALILIGYLGGRFAQQQPLGFSASITFEQSYDEIDGDSASSAELYALLSSLSGIPINQGIAVTGSVNQLGEIQPIGGVNEKIEGVYRVCKSRGLTGDQGVMIPKTNVQNLMLDREVIQAVKDGLFNVYAISTIDEGITILTGVEAGKIEKNGDWTKNSVNYLVQQKLNTYTDIIKYSPNTSLDIKL